MDLFEKLAQEAGDVLTDEARLGIVQEKGQEAITLQNSIAELEDTVSAKKKELTELTRKTLPDLMNGIGIDTLGISDTGYQITLSGFAKAGISADWDDERKEKGFTHLIKMGGGDLIRSDLVVSAGKDSLEFLEKFLMPVVAAVLETHDVGAVVSVKKTVPWNSLTSWVREYEEKRASDDEDTLPELDLDALGATIGEIVKIKKRK